MFDFFSDLFSPVVNWVTDTAGESVGAVVGAVLDGAAAGAIIGAAHAAIKGDDILKGALKGAAVGGIASGVVSSLGQLSGMEQFSASNQLNAMGFDQADTPQGEIQIGMSGETPVTTDKNVPQSNNYTSQQSPNRGILSSENEKPSFFKTDEGAKVIAGVGQGLATGAANYLSAKEQSEAQKKAMEYKTQVDKDKIAANQPSKDFQAKTAKISVRKWWDDRISGDTAAITKNIGVA